VFKVAKAGQVNLQLYDMTGKAVANVYNGFVEKGRTIKVDYNNSKLIPGIYIGRLLTAGGVTERKIVKTQ
jgi:hypothetical protein